MSDGNTLIRVPCQTNGRPDVMRFKLSKDSHINGIVATLADLYRGKRPFPSTSLASIVTG